MSMTVVVTRNVPDRFRGFLASCMCEIAPGVYTAPRMNAGIRERVQKVLQEWFEPDTDWGIVMTWVDQKQPGGQSLWNLGSPRTELRKHCGIFLAKRDLSQEAIKKLAKSVDASLTQEAELIREELKASRSLTTEEKKQESKTTRSEWA